MGKNKPRRGASGAMVSPQAKQGTSTQVDQPVTDTVMGVIARRIRNAKKKLNKVADIEALVKAGTELNDDQERVFQTKGPLTAVIEELGKLEPLVQAAFSNELNEYLADAKVQWAKEEIPRDEPQASDVANVSEAEESDNTTEEEQKDSDSNPDETGKEEIGEEHDATSNVVTEPSPRLETSIFNAIIETIYFVNILTKDRFDLAPLIGDSSQSMQGVISSEEAEFLEAFGKRIFKNVSHVPREALEMAKETAQCLCFPDHPDTIRLVEIVEKLKSSDVMDNEMKLTVHGFPLTLEKEASDTTTDNTDKSGEKSKQENPVRLETTPPPQEPSPPIDEQPTQPTPGFLTSSSHFAHPMDNSAIASKGPRPFLPFPQVGMSGGPSMNFAMTQPTHMADMHAYYSNVTAYGHYSNPAQYPPAHTPPVQASTSTLPPSIEEPNPPEETSSATPTAQATVEVENSRDPEFTTTEAPVAEPVRVEDTKECNPENEQVVHPDPATSQSEIPADAAGSTGVSQSSERNPPAQQQHRAYNGGGRGNYNPRAHADHRPWQNRGRHQNPGRYSSRSRGFRGRYPPSGGPPRRPPYDQRSQFDPNYRPPFPHHSGNDRNPYSFRPRRGGGGYDRGNK